MRKEKKKAFFWGFIAIMSMSGFYFLTMRLSMPLAELWWNFQSSWYLITALILGFGLQIGLWSYLRNYPSQHLSGIIPGASGAMSNTAMLVCCSHHLFDALPFLGLAGSVLFLAQYQKFFLLLGLTINIFSIAYMLYLLNKKQSNCEVSASDKKI